MEINYSRIINLFLAHGCRVASPNQIRQIAFFYPKTSALTNSSELLHIFGKVCKTVFVQEIEVFNPEIQAKPEKETFLVGYLKLHSRVRINTLKKRFCKELKNITFFRIVNSKSFETFCLKSEFRVEEPFRRVQITLERNFAEPK